MTNDTTYMRNYMRKWRQKNRAKYKKYQQEYYALNKKERTLEQ